LDSDSRGTGEKVGRQPVAKAEAPPIRELTARLVKGDEEAFRFFYDAYFERLSRYMLVVTTGDERAAKDAVQGMLVRLVRYIRVFSDEDVFWSWITMLARSSLADDKRKKRRYLSFLDRFQRQSEIQDQPINESSTEAKLADLLDQKINTLAKHERELLELKYFSHQSVRSISEQLGLTEKAVESSLVRIRRKLRESVMEDLKK
jgi:RNA polymerase sigma-70 factor (ECF subfamily)